MLESLIALGVILVVVCLPEAAEARGIRVPILGRIFELLAEAMWRLWLLLIALTIVAIAMVVAFDASGVPIVAWLAGVVALVAVVAVARRVFDWRFDGLVRRSDRTHRRYPVERRIEDAHSEGWEALKRRRFEQAASAYREAADLGDVDAMVNLANILSDELDSSTRQSVGTGVRSRPVARQRPRTWPSSASTRIASKRRKSCLSSRAVAATRRGISGWPISPLTRASSSERELCWRSRSSRAN